MQIVKPSWNFTQDFDGIDILRHIEYIGRTCYKSHDLNEELDIEKTKRFIKNIITRNHESVLEHHSISLEIITDRAVMAELTRHRMASFCIESQRYCIAGDTKLKFLNPHHNFTISELYKNKMQSKNGSWKRVKIKFYNEDSKLLDYTTIKDIYYNGSKDVYEVNTKYGYRIKVTLDHKLKTPDGYKELNLIKVGDKIAVNGTKRLFINYDWLYNQYITLNKTSVQIAKETGVSSSCIKVWIKKHKLPKKPQSYWSKELIPWNKGLKEGDCEGVDKQIESLRKYHWNSKNTENKTAKERIMKLGKSNYKHMVENNCSICCDNKDLIVHHIDENRENNNVENLVTLCRKCHSQIHNKSLETIIYDEIVSIIKVGNEDVYDLEINNVSHNYVANGIIVHNCNYSKDKYNNEITFVLPSFLNGVDENSDKYKLWKYSCTEAEQYYLKLLETGCKPEEARSVLPNSTKTHIQITANLREWRHIFKLRTSAAAHPDMRILMRDILQSFQTNIPIIFDDIKGE